MLNVRGRSRTTKRLIRRRPQLGTLFAREGDGAGSTISYLLHVNRGGRCKQKRAISKARKHRASDRGSTQLPTMWNGHTKCTRHVRDGLVLYP